MMLQQNIEFENVVKFPVFRPVGGDSQLI